MKRPVTYWAWLLADVSLDRAATVLPLLGFPPGSHTGVQQCFDALGRFDAAVATDSALLRLLDDHLRTALGDAAPDVERWLEAFPFTSETSHPELFYWSSRFDDLLLVDKAPPPDHVSPEAWNALLDAYQGHPLNAPAPLTSALSSAAAARAKLRAVNHAIDAARAQPLSPHDLDVYLRWGWNDDGTQQGLTSLQIGTRLDTTRQFWAAIAPYFPADAFLQLAYERDLAVWRRAADPAQFAKDAQKYGVPTEQMAADVFPRPEAPPSPDSLLST